MASPSVNRDEVRLQADLGAGSGLFPSGFAKTAGAPFNDTTADVILRSCDRIDFYVFRTVLALASRFFKTMFSLKQPATEPSSSQNTLPIIDFTEDSATLDILLRFCYPVMNPDILPDDSEKFHRALAAAIKYEITVVVESLRRQLMNRATAIPMKVFAIAARNNLETDAALAASHWALGKRRVVGDDTADLFTSTTAGVVYGDEMADVTAGSYFRLLRYLRKTTPFPPAFLSVSSSPVFGTFIKPPSWSTKAPFNRQDSDVALVSSDEQLFPTHKLILQFAGADSLLGPDPTRDRVTIALHSSVLGPLLSICYPSSVGSSLEDSTCRVIGDVIHATIVHKMQPLTQSIRSAWSRLVGSNSDVLGMYLIAARLKWLTEAQYAASKLLEGPLTTVYSSELERTPAAVYQGILEYHHNSQIALRNAYKTFENVQPHPYSSGSFGERWRKNWFTERSGRYFRSVPIVLAEAKDLRSAFKEDRSFQEMLATCDKLDAAAEDAAKGVKLKI